MLTRRSALKIAAALGASRAVPSSVSPAEAARLLAQPATAAVPSDGDRPAWLDPARFAAEADLRGYNAFDDLLGIIAAEDYAEYKRQYQALFASLPILRDVRFDHPVVKLDEAALAMMFAAYSEGLAAGAAYEHLRVALVGPMHVCPRCDGYGMLDAEAGKVYGKAHEPAGPCSLCAGHGTVPQAIGLAESKRVRDESHAKWEAERAARREGGEAA